MYTTSKSARDNPFFHYENVGQADKIMIADGLYGKLVNDLLKDCLKKKKAKSRERVKTENAMNSASTSSKIVATSKLKNS